MSALEQATAARQRLAEIRFPYEVKFADWPDYDGERSAPSFRAWVFDVPESEVESVESEFRLAIEAAGVWPFGLFLFTPDERQQALEGLEWFLEYSIAASERRDATVADLVITFETVSLPPTPAVVVVTVEMSDAVDEREAEGEIRLGVTGSQNGSFDKPHAQLVTTEAQVFDFHMDAA